MNPSIGLSREVLRLTIVDVRKHAPDVKLREAEIYRVGGTRNNLWQFLYGAFYWHGRADNAYEARSKGWSAWLEKQGAEGYGQKEIE